MTFRTGLAGAHRSLRKLLEPETAENAAVSPSSVFSLRLSPHLLDSPSLPGLSLVSDLHEPVQPHAETNWQKRKPLFQSPAGSTRAVPCGWEVARAALSFSGRNSEPESRSHGSAHLTLQRNQSRALGCEGPVFPVQYAFISELNKLLETIIPYF